MRLMQACARAGDPVACFMVALWYRKGEGAPASLAQSARWLERREELAEQGDAEAQYELGMDHRFGNLVPLNIARANYWLERAADAGWGEAQHHLAWYFETGQYDYPQDSGEAEAWYRRALEQEHPETLYLCGIRAFEDGQPTEEAVRLLRKAADRGFTEAERVLRSTTH